MGSSPQPPAKQRIKNALGQRLPDAQALTPSEVHSKYSAFVERFRSTTESKTPKEECAAAHRSGEIFEGGYRGDGR
jgi:hypothetical protein